jgi:hypothetical protein
VGSTPTAGTRFRYRLGPPGAAIPRQFAGFSSYRLLGACGKFQTLTFASDRHVPPRAAPCVGKRITDHSRLGPPRSLGPSACAEAQRSGTSAGPAAPGAVTSDFAF